MNMTFTHGIEDKRNLQFVPVVVGVTGHRDIPAEDIPALKTSIKVQLKKFRDRCPHSPLLLLTGLAEGADRLVACCALELNALEQEKPRWSIGAVLALPQTEFEKDFESEASLAEFRGLLAQCVWVREVSPAGTTRPECYEIVGNWLAMQAQWLIALWDGKENDKKGGTACVVRLFREGIKLARPVLPDTGPVAHILTRRQSELKETDVQRVGCTSDLPPIPIGMGRDSKDRGDKEIVRWQTVLDRIDEFNCRIGNLNDSDFKKIQQRRAYLNADKVLVDTDLTVSALRSSWLHAAADYLAMDAQKWRLGQFAVMLTLAIAGLGFEQYYSGPAAGEGWKIAIWLALAISCGVLALAATAFSWLSVEARYLDYRALAEACRVQYFWSRSGIDKCAADFHLFDQRDELEWIRQAVRTTALGRTEDQEIICNDRLRNVLNCWITDQKNYYMGEKKGFPSHERKTSILNRLTFAFLASAGVLMVVTLAVQVSSNTDLVKWLQFSYGMLLTCAAATKVYLQVQGHEEHARSYLRTWQSMQIAEMMIESSLEGEGAIGTVQTLLYDVGREALNENGDWLLLHRERPIQASI